MGAPIRKVLVVVVDPGVYSRFGPLLQRQGFDADWVGSPAVAAELIAAVSFDVLILGFPLGQPTTHQLCDLARPEQAPCSRAAILVMAAEEDLTEAGKLAADGRIRVVSLAADQATLRAEVASLLRIAPRLTVRLPIRLEVQLGEGRAVALSQTENVSASGMLVRSNRSYPVEAGIRFELFIPEQTGAVSGDGQVVRHTLDQRGRPSGMGVKFLSWDGAGQARLAEYLAKVSPEPGRP
jgi:hypothetical protein